MEAGDRFKNDEKYKMPLTVFDVIRIQKLSGTTVRESEVRVNTTHKDEGLYKEFYFPLSDVF